MFLTVTLLMAVPLSALAADYRKSPEQLTEELKALVYAHSVYHLFYVAGLEENSQHRKNLIRAIGTYYSKVAPIMLEGDWVNELETELAPEMIEVFAENTAITGWITARAILIGERLGYMNNVVEEFWVPSEDETGAVLEILIEEKDFDPRKAFEHALGVYHSSLKR